MWRRRWVCLIKILVVILVINKILNLSKILRSLIEVLIRLVKNYRVGEVTNYVEILWSFFEVF